MSGLEVASAIAGLIGLAQTLISAAKVRGRGHINAHWAIVIQELVSLLDTAQTWLQDSAVIAKVRTDFRLHYELYFLRMKVVSMHDYLNCLHTSLGEDLPIWHNKEAVTNYLDAQVSAIRECLRNVFQAYIAASTFPLAPAPVVARTYENNPSRSKKRKTREDEASANKAFDEKGNAAAVEYQGVEHETAVSPASTGNLFDSVTTPPGVFGAPSPAAAGEKHSAALTGEDLKLGPFAPPPLGSLFGSTSTAPSMFGWLGAASSQAFPPLVNSTESRVINDEWFQKAVLAERPQDGEDDNKESSE